VPIYESRNEEVSARAGLEALFALEQPPTAIFAESDRIALAAILWLSERGFSVPGDISVIGFDGVAEAATSTPALTTIAQPIVEIGRLAVDEILDYRGTARHQNLPLELVVRASTAPPRS
jgi:DNA-binding LacI/PurR family transcriptional regulator